MWRAVADFEGPIVQLLLPSTSVTSRFRAAVSRAIRKLWVASVNTLSTSFGRQGSSPSGTLGSQGGWRPKRNWSYLGPFSGPVLHTVLARAISLLRLRERPLLRIRTTSAGSQSDGVYPKSLNSGGTWSGFDASQRT